MVFGVLLSMVAMAQETRVIDGRTYTVHVVEAGQTLFAIGRAHAVPVDALIKANPGSEAGLSIGQELLVPRDAVMRKEARSAPVLLRDGELSHTVAKRETLFGIARAYGVDINDLLERNPELNAGLREGMLVVVPTAKVTGQEEAVVRPAVEEEWVEHTVIPGETLYGLGRHYGVAPERIAAVNELDEGGLKAGMVVRVPVAVGEVPPPSQAPSFTVPPGQRYKVAILPPFSLDRNDSLLAASSQRDARFHEATRIAAQFYGGVSIALDSLRGLGLDAEVLVEDMGEDARAWSTVVRDPGLGDVDLFIGPFHRSAIEQLAKAVPTAHIVCPVPQSNKVVLGNPMVSKVTATRVDLVRHTGRYVALRHVRDNIILVRPDIHAEKDGQEQMRRAIEGALSTMGRGHEGVPVVVQTGRRDPAPVVAKLVNDRLNVVVVPSDDVEFVTALVTKLKSLAGKQRMIVVGMESWLSMETVSVNDLDALGFMHAAGTFVDHEDPRTRAFIAEFRERWNNDAGEYAFLGFDVTFHYLSALMAHGRSFPEHFQEVLTHPLHMGFRLTRTGPENGFRNEYAVMLKLQDLRLVKAP